MKLSFGTRADSRLALVLVGIVGLTGCTSSTVGTDRYERGQVRLVELANETLDLVPSNAKFVPHRHLTISDTDRESCHKTFAGFVYSKLAARQPEVTAIVELPSGTDARAVLALIEAAWRSKHYSVDTRELRDPGFAKLSASIDGYRLIVTSFSKTAGFADKPRISVYAVGQCLNHS